MSEPIRVQGSFFWRNNKRFMVRGVVYQIHDTPQPVDPIADDRIEQLQRDVTLLKELGVNTIFVFSIDNSKAHDRAMKLLQEAGIYVLTTITTPRCSINRLALYGSYNESTMNYFFETVDVMAKYSNSLGLFAAYELINNDDYQACMFVIAAVVRDIKKYMRLKNESNGQRILPTGYGAAMTGAQDHAILDYLSSGDETERIDFWTCKCFSWNRDSNMETSGYNDLIKQYQGPKLPIFFSEYGGIAQKPRLFHDTRALYSAEMTKIFSGGCVYEFWQGANNYGLAQIERNREEQAGRLARPRNGGRVVETWETEAGTVLLYEDFMNFRESLRATADLAPDTHRDLPGGGLDEKNSAWKQTSSQWFPAGAGQIPKSCVDWEKVAQELKNR